MRYFYLLLSCSLIFFTSCSSYSSDEPKPALGDEWGWAPVYSQDSDLHTIISKGPTAVTNAGQACVSGHYIFLNETGEGIHVFDMAQPAKPVNLSFIKVTGSTRIAVNNGYLVTDNITDLVIIDISNPKKAIEAGRIKDVLPGISRFYPPQRGWFECVDTSKGQVVGWERKMLFKPKCYR